MSAAGLLSRPDAGLSFPHPAVSSVQALSAFTGTAVPQESITSPRHFNRALVAGSFDLAFLESHPARARGAALIDAAPSAPFGGF